MRGQLSLLSCCFFWDPCRFFHLMLDIYVYRCRFYASTLIKSQRETGMHAGRQASRQMSRDAGAHGGAAEGRLQCPIQWCRNSREADQTSADLFEWTTECRLKSTVRTSSSSSAAASPSSLSSSLVVLVVIVTIKINWLTLYKSTCILSRLRRRHEWRTEGGEERKTKKERKKQRRKEEIDKGKIERKWAKAGNRKEGKKGRR